MSTSHKPGSPKHSFHFEVGHRNVFSWGRWYSIQDTCYLLPACQVINSILLVHIVLQYLTEFGEVFYITTLSSCLHYVKSVADEGNMFVDDWYNNTNRETRGTNKETQLTATFSTEIPRGLTWDRAQAPSLGRRQRREQAMARAWS
jgi:hypothetical protein